MKQIKKKVKEKDKVLQMGDLFCCSLEKRKHRIEGVQTLLGFPVEEV